jgi:hypothetical protein
MTGSMKSRLVTCSSGGKSTLTWNFVIFSESRTHRQGKDKVAEKQRRGTIEKANREIKIIRNPFLAMTRSFSISHTIFFHRNYQPHPPYTLPKIIFTFGSYPHSSIQDVYSILTPQNPHHRRSERIGRGLARILASKGPQNLPSRQQHHRTIPHHQHPQQTLSLLNNQ